MVAAFLVPMINRVKRNNPIGVQNAVMFRDSSAKGTDQYCFNPSAENLYLYLATLYPVNDNDTEFRIISQKSKIRQLSQSPYTLR